MTDTTLDVSARPLNTSLYSSAVGQTLVCFEAQSAVFGGESGEHLPVSGDEWDLHDLSQCQEVSVVDSEVVLQVEVYRGVQDVDTERNDLDAERLERLQVLQDYLFGETRVAQSVCRLK